MDLKTPLSVRDIARMIDAEIVGNADNMVLGINEINKVRTGDLTFVDTEKYYHKSVNSDATIIIINKITDVPLGKTLLVCDAPFDAYQMLTRKYAPVVVPTAAIDPQTEIGEGTRIDPNVVIYPNVKIGKNCLIRANVTIYENTIIGDNVLIHSGSVIGSEAFYYNNKGTHFAKWHSCGRVLIQNDVEIGASCTIDKGVSGDTIIGIGSKLDNQVHIGHGVVIGKKCLIAAQVGIAGKTIIEDFVKIWGQAGLASKVRIGEGAQIMAQSGVSKDLEAGKMYFGTPVAESGAWFNEFRFMKTLPRRIEKLEAAAKAAEQEKTKKDEE